MSNSVLKVPASIIHSKCKQLYLYIIWSYVYWNKFYKYFIKMSFFQYKQSTLYVERETASQILLIHSPILVRRYLCYTVVSSSPRWSIHNLNEKYFLWTITFYYTILTPLVWRLLSQFDPEGPPWPFLYSAEVVRNLIRKFLLRFEFISMNWLWLQCSSLLIFSMTRIDFLFLVEDHFFRKTSLMLFKFG